MDTFSWIHYSDESSIKQWKNILLKAREELTGLIITAKQKELKAIEKIVPRDLEIHIWFWTMICTDPEIMNNHRDWYNVNRNGNSSLDQPPYVNYYKWLCPNNPAVLPYLKKKLGQYLQLDFIKGISLDYIRYPDVILPEALQPLYNLKQDKEFPEYDFCYCQHCLKAFREQTHLDPFHLSTEAEIQAWASFREESITKVVTELSGLIRDNGFEVSASVFPTPKIARKLVRQDWAAWHLDKIFPMNYYNFYNKDLKWFGKVIKEGKSVIGSNTDYYPALYVPTMNFSEFKTSLQISVQSEVEGIALFDFLSTKPEYWEILNHYR